DGWLLTDLGSRNGTFVNEKRVEQAVLAPMDQVRIGNAIFKFVDRGIEPYLGYRIDGTRNGEGLADDTAFAELVGGAHIRAMARDLAGPARSALPILVLGETGTGKELVAHAVHAASGRRGPFVAVNGAAIPATLIESQLFGFRRGAFTGAATDRDGLV